MSKKISRPSKADWEQHRNEITEIYRAHGLEKVMKTMEKKGFFAEDYHYQYRFRRWDIEKYTRKDTIDNLFNKILDHHKHNRPPPRLSSRDLGKLIRRYKEKEKDESGFSDPILKNLLQQMRDLIVLPVDKSGTDDNADCDDEKSDEELDSSMDDAVAIESSDADENSDDDFESLDMPSYEGIVSELNDVTIATSIEHLQLSFHDDSTKLEDILRLTQAHYRASIQHYLSSQGSKVIVSSASPPMLPLGQENTVDSLALNKTFWRKVKSGIYFLKMGSEDLAIPLLRESSTIIPLLCEQQPFTILKDIFATLSPTNIAIKKDILSSLLRIFAVGANNQFPRQQNHPFALICHRLENESLFEEASIIGLRLLLEISKELLTQDHEEVYEIERTLIRLLRRQGRLADAKQRSWLLIERSIHLYGKYNVRTRLAMTELVYVLNDQGRYKKSKGVAEMIVARCRPDDGDEVQPDQRSIYAMEDLAFICERLGRMSDAICWLRRAQKDAISLWKDKEGAAHINRKLEDIYSKIGR